MEEPSRTGAGSWLPHVALCLVSVLFGVNYVVSKMAMREVSPLDLVAIRTSCTAAILFLATLLQPRGAPPAKLTRPDYRDLFVYSLLGASINQLCFLAGLDRSSATNASLMLVCIPLLTLAFAVLLRRERASGRDVIGIAIGLTGALLLIIPRGNVALSSTAALGNVLLLGGGSSYALFLVLTRPILRRHDPLRVTSWVFLFSALTVFPFAFGGLRALSYGAISAEGWGSIVYVVIGATAIPYLLNSWALVRVKSSIVAIYILLQPIVAAWLGRVYLREHFGPHTALAALLVISGVAVSGWRRG